jgi:hypothetical protein
MLKFMCGVIVGATVSVAYAQDVSQQIEAIKKAVTTPLPYTSSALPLQISKTFMLAGGEDAKGVAHALVVNEDGSVNCAK